AHTTFFIDIMVSLGIALVLFGISWPIASYYESPVLGTMLKLYSVNIVVASFMRTPLALYKRDIQFNVVGESELIYVISSESLKLLFAILGFGALCFPLGI